MTIGSVLNETYEYLRKGWRDYALLSGAVFVPLGLLTALAQHGSANDSIRSVYVWGVVSKVAIIVLSTWLQAAVVVRSEEQRHGRGLPGIRETYELVKPHLFTVLAVSAVSAAVFLALSLLGVVGLPILIFLLTRWVVLVPIVVVEGVPGRAVFRRANDLAKGKFFDLLLLALLSVILLAVVFMVGAAIASPLPRFGATWFATTFVGALGIPVTMLMWTVAYFQIARRPGGVQVAR